MNKVSRGYSGLAIYHPKHGVNVGSLFRTAYILGINFVNIIGKNQSRDLKQSSDTTKSIRHIPFTRYITFEDFYRFMPYGCQLVGVELDKKAVPVSDFQHPERAIYLLGAEDYGIPPRVLSRCHSVVQLPGKYCLNVAVAGSIILFDRINKRGLVSYENH